MPSKKVALAETMPAVVPVTAGALMHAPVSELSTDSVVNTWLMLTLIESMTEERKKELRARLLDEATKHGSKTEQGGYKMDLPNAAVIHERREEKQINADKMAELLQSKGLPTEAAMDEVVSLVVNLSKVQYLIQIGKLTQAEVDNLKAVTSALRVTPTKEAKKLLEGMKEASKNALKEKE